MYNYAFPSGKSNEIDAVMLVRKQGNDSNKTSKEADEDLEEDEEDASLKVLQEELSEIRRNMHENHGRLEDEALNRLFLKKLKSKECSNQGYVLDGYPKTFEQAKGLFGAREDLDEDQDDETGDEEAEIAADFSIMPELVVALEASDEYLKERIINRPEREIQHTHYTEEHMIRRLREYRERNTDENSPLQFFDEIEVHPLVIPIEDDVCPEMFPTIYQCLEKLGKPRNYGRSEDETHEAVEAEKQALSEKLRKEREISERKRLREEKMMEWTDLMEKLKQEEEERLCVMGEPLRHYLMKHVFPTLTQGLIEVAKLRPDDPVDFLAEYLFKKNPEGKMFEPDYTETMSMLLDRIEKLQTDIFPREELSEEDRELLKNEHGTSADGIDESSAEDVCSNRRTTPRRISSSSGEEGGWEDKGQEVPSSNRTHEYEGDA
ncbi:hypothetical protein KM043_013684 [Ampulex compressa]|nr:hypothetical protein KM043_013684 [Ampulex compressa]